VLLLGQALGLDGVHAHRLPDALGDGSRSPVKIEIRRTPSSRILLDDLVALRRSLSSSPTAPRYCPSLQHDVHAGHALDALLDRVMDSDRCRG
jgi:hypothetical protein